MRFFLLLRHFKFFLFYVFYFSLSFNFDLWASENLHPGHLEINILSLSHKNQNILEYNLVSKETIFESDFKNKLTRPLKNQMALAELLKSPVHKNTVIDLLQNTQVDRIRMVYCNTYAIFFLKNDNIVHTFFLSYVEGALEVKSFRS